MSEPPPSDLPPLPVTTAAAETPPSPAAAAATGPAPTGRPWSGDAIAAISFFFSPLPAGILFALNWDRLGVPGRRGKYLALVLVGSAIFFAAAFAAPDKTPHTIFLAINLGVAALYRKGQKQLIDEHKARGGKLASPLVPVLLSLGGLVVGGGVLFGVAMKQVEADSAEFNRGVKLMREGKLDEAEPIFVAYKKRLPEEGATYWNLAHIYQARDQQAKARAEIDQLMKVDARYEGVQKFIHELDDDQAFSDGVAKMKSGDLAAAETIFQRLRTRRPEVPEIYWNLAYIHVRQGRVDDAQRDADELLRRFPDHKDKQKLLDSIAAAREHPPAK